MTPWWMWQEALASTRLDRDPDVGTYAIGEDGQLHTPDDYIRICGDLWHINDILSPADLAAEEHDEHHDEEGDPC